MHHSLKTRGRPAQKFCEASFSVSSCLHHGGHRGGVQSIPPTGQLGRRSLPGRCGLARRPKRRRARPGPAGCLLWTGLLCAGPSPDGLAGPGRGTRLLGAGRFAVGSSPRGLAGGAATSRLLGFRFRCRRLCRFATKTKAFGELGSPLGIVGSRRRVVRRQLPAKLVLADRQSVPGV